MRVNASDGKAEASGRTGSGCVSGFLLEAVVHRSASLVYSFSLFMRLFNVPIDYRTIEYGI